MRESNLGIRLYTLCITGLSYAIGAAVAAAAFMCVKFMYIAFSTSSHHGFITKWSGMLSGRCLARKISGPFNPLMVGMNVVYPTWIPTVFLFTLVVQVPTEMIIIFNNMRQLF